MDLKVLFLDYAAIIDDKDLDTISSYKKLEVLSLEGTLVSDGVYDALASLPFLRTLNISNTRVTREMYEKLREDRNWSDLIFDHSFDGKDFEPEMRDANPFVDLSA